jgi:Na+-translocating ferredoxin:NAD+ oxidoreductase subunit G
MTAVARVLVRDVIITTLLLSLFAAVGAGLVAWVHLATEAKIVENELAVTRARVTELLKGLDYGNDPVTDHTTAGHARLGGQDLPVWFARRGDEITGVVLSAIAPNGYSGSIHLLVGIDRAGNVLGVRVTRHRETPGLGDDIEADRSDWILGFRGRSLDNPPIELWRVRRDGGIFDQFTGATVTPRAVVQAVANALVYFRDHAEELLATPPPESGGAVEIQPLPPLESEFVTPRGAVPGTAPELPEPPIAVEVEP